MRLDVAYDGTDFSGWAVQPGRRTVQAVLERALETVLRQPPGTCRLTVAGRTDAGVHARGQVCSVDLPIAADEVTVVHRRLSGVLPDDVAVRRVSAVSDDFDARFSATWRRYAYRFCDNPECLDPLRRRETLHWPRPLDETAMSAAATGLLGEHDFAAFCRRRADASTVRTLRRLECARVDQLLVCTAVADSFCHTMVRSLVGCLIAVGEHRRPGDWPARVLAAGVRDSAVPVLPPQGLTLEEVGYPVEAGRTSPSGDGKASGGVA